MSSDNDHDDELPVNEAAPRIGQLRIAIVCVQGIVAGLLLRLVAPTDYLVSIALPSPPRMMLRRPLA
jgi:hypothetical protein